MFHRVASSKNSSVCHSNYDIDDRLRQLQTDLERRVAEAHTEHKQLCAAELRIFSDFIGNEGFDSITTYSELVRHFEATQPLIDKAIRGLALRREEAKFLHEHHANRLKQHIRRLQLATLPEAMETGRRFLLCDAAKKMEDTLCSKKMMRKYGDERSIALSLLFRYPELKEHTVVASLSTPNTTPTTTADKRKFACYLMIAEKEVDRHPLLARWRRHYEVLFQWTWDTSIQAAETILEEHCSLEERPQQSPLLAPKLLQEAEAATVAYYRPPEAATTVYHRLPEAASAALDYQPLQGSGAATAIYHQKSRLDQNQREDQAPLNTNSATCTPKDDQHRLSTGYSTLPEPYAAPRLRRQTAPLINSVGRKSQQSSYYDDLVPYVTTADDSTKVQASTHRRMESTPNPSGPISSHVRPEFQKQAARPPEVDTGSSSKPSRISRLASFGRKKGEQKRDSWF